MRPSGLFRSGLAEIRRTLGLLTVCLVALVSARGGELPNVLLIISDDHAWFDYGFMRRTNVEPVINTVAASNDTDGVNDTGLRVRNLVRTPNVDRLADGGLAFTRAYSPMALCRPSLMSIATGLYPHQHRVLGNDPQPSSAEDAGYDDRVRDVQCLPRILGLRRGYASFQTGKWWQGHYSAGGFTCGDTVNSTSAALRPPQWSGSMPGYVMARHGDWGLMIGRVDYVTDTASPAAPINYANTLLPLTDFMDAQIASNKSFFAWYAPLLPHDPHDAPASMIQYYQNLGVDYWTANYYACIERLDGTVGALLDYLEARGIASNTIVIYCADNGWAQNPNVDNNWLAKSKLSPYDGGLRTPLLVRWPQRINTNNVVLRPQVVSQPVSTVDIAPTVLAALSLSRAADMQGVNLLDLDAVRARHTVFGDCYNVNDTITSNTTNTLEFRWAVRDGWKLILRDNGSGGPELYRLYDYSTNPAGVAVDPFETANLAGAQPGRVQELNNAIVQWYDPNRTLARRTDQCVAVVERLVPLAGELGQTWTAAKAGYLHGVKLVVRPTGPPRDLSIELRSLDGSGRPLGDLLSTAKVAAGQFTAGESRWYTFLFPQPPAQVAGTQYGIRVLAGSGAFDLGYSACGAYPGGGMYFSGTLQLAGTGYTWPSPALDLAFETLIGSFNSAPETALDVAAGEPAQACVAASFPAKGTSVQLYGSPDLQTWQPLGTVVSNRDGLVGWTCSVTGQPRYYYCAQETLAGAVANPSLPDPDTNAPAPNPAQFASAPLALSAASVTMTAVTGTDTSGPVQYYFDELSGNAGGSDSGWQTSPTYVDSALSPLTAYSYTIRMRDGLGNTGSASASQNVTTPALPAPDTNAPTPNPAQFATAPTALSAAAVTMTAVAGTDATGPVEYYFEETSGNAGGSDSSWQTSPAYADTGLSPQTTYSYTVRMRDALGNTGNASAAQNVTTPALPANDTTPPTPNPAQFAVIPTALDAYSVTMTAVTGADATAPVEYYFDEASGHAGGTDSGWQTSPTYVDSGLSPLTTYYYNVRMRDALGNGGSAAALRSVTTPAGAATTLYDDHFDGSGSLPWSKAGALGAFSSANGAVAAGSGLALLPFTPAAGKRYELSATIWNNGFDWIAVGFCESATASGNSTFTTSGYNGYAWMLTRDQQPDENRDQLAHLGPGANPVYSNNQAPPGSPVTLTVRLDTTVTPWTASYFVNGAAFGPVSTNLPASASAIRGCGVSAANTDGDGVVSRFTLTEQ